MSKKPLILVNHLLEPPNRVSGITRYLFALLERLALRSNYRCVLATTWSASALPASLRNSSIDVVTLPFHSSMPVNVANQLSTIPRLMRETGAVLEFNCNPIGCFRSGWPRVITVHDLYYETIPSAYPWRHRFWWQVLFPASLRSASAVVCVSWNTRRELEARHPASRSKVSVVHEAAVVDRDAPAKAGPPLNAPYGLYVGNISPNKNPTVLIAALSILRDRGWLPAIYHVGSDSAGLLAKAQQSMSGAPLVLNAGALSDEQLNAAYRGATCLVNTSLNEGFCLPVVEAQSFGLPVICADIPVLREVAGEGALFFPPNDALSLAECLTMIFGDAVARKRMAARSLKNAARFSWSRAAMETEDIFDAVLGANAIEHAGDSSLQRARAVA